MTRQRTTKVPLRLEEVKAKLETWRRTREQRSAIPEQLWTEAVEVARDIGINRVSVSLGISYYGLKKRIEQGGSLTVSTAEDKAAKFIEMTLAPSNPGRRETVTEFEMVRVDGTQVRMRHCGDVDVVKLVGTIWAGA